MKSLEIIPLQGTIKSEVTIPGSKSYTNRALLMAAMTQGRVTILNPLMSDDTRAMLNCLATLGVVIALKKDSLEVVNDVSHVKDQAYELDADLSGTTIRFMTALSCIVPGIQTLYGKEGLNKRPIADLVDGLRQLGAEIEYLENEGCPPIRVSSSTLTSGMIRMNGGVSSQYFSAILMIAPLVGGLTIEVEGEQISKPYIDMTIDTMKRFGVAVANDNYKKYSVPAHQSYRISEYVVEGDVSSASYFAAIAVLTNSTLTLKNMNAESVQADMGFLKILESMGTSIIYGQNEITVSGAGVKALTVDMENCPDQAQTLAVLAAFASGVTTISGIRSLRVKETERVKALEQELAKMDIRTSSTADSLTIHGGSPRGAFIDTHGDHRMAMAFAVAGAKLSGVKINDPDVVGKTFPNFWEKLNSIGVRTLPVNKNIVLLGMRGSGKSTIAKLLSENLNREMFELDSLIVQKAGMSIPEIVEKNGWDFFRDQEVAVVEDVSERTGAIISTGGGVVLREENVERLKRNGVLVYLTASPVVLAKRIGDDPNRPQLTAMNSLEEELEEVARQREELYKKAADSIINAEGSPQDVAWQIIASL